MRQTPKTVTIALSTVVALASACSASPDASSVDDEVSVTGEGRAIKGGVVASGYPEAALVNMKKNGQLVAACSGSVIAPRVVLTAGHCVTGFDGWDIVVPYANGQKRSSTSAEVFDYTTIASYVDPNKHDVGLVFVDADIKLTEYPALASAAIPTGSKVVNVGRIKDGAFSSTNLFVGPPLTVKSGSSVGYPFDYAATSVLESGDSGGPDILAGSSPHLVVGVNSGSGGGTEILARVDLVGQWIMDRIVAHGGPGGGGAASCGDGTCGAGESCQTCAADCGACPPPQCVHATCSTGSKLASGCDACVTSICSADPYCCTTAWDAQCVNEVGSFCGGSCGGGGGGGGGGGPSCGNGSCEAGESCSSCAADCGTCEPSSCEGAGPATTPLDANEQAFLTILNQYRSQNGLGAVSGCTSLSRAAQGHSEDMRDANYFSHTGLDGSTPWSRACDACYEKGCGPSTAMGEIIAAGYPSAQTVFNAWKNSPGHNAIMLGSSFTKVGLGLANGGGYGTYWTGLFGGADEASCQ